MNTEIIPRSLGTHDGTFHADEVTACGLLLVYDFIDKDKIVRTRNPDLLAKCEYICDVGGIYKPNLKRFDHHQIDYQGGLSSAGMVWLYFKESGVIDELTYAFFNRSLIFGVDAHDTGKVVQEIGVCTFSLVIANFVPPMYDAPMELTQSAFFDALDFTVGHLKRLKERFLYIQECQGAVAESMKKNLPYLLFEKAMPWLENFFDLGGRTHPALFVIMPSGGHWKLRAIPPSIEDRMRVRHPLPAEWAGLLEDDLKRVSGIQGAIFCHKERFISVWETKEDALKALEIILKRTNE